MMQFTFDIPMEHPVKTIGLIGGMSWESTVSYYQAINRGVNQKLGGLHSAKLCLYSVDFEEIQLLQHQDKWADTAEILSNAAQSTVAGGADAILICTNTMHKVADEVASSVDVPLLHIADATGAAIAKAGYSTIGLLGTRFTMEQDFYKQRLQDKYGLEVLTPSHDDRTKVHDVIYNKLCQGIVDPSDRQTYLAIMDKMSKQGAQGIILGCTEIALLVKPEHTALPLFDTAAIHAQAAVDFALS